ncbi:MAG: hypothetical protein R3F34_04295 [Planctomycetota bacterium]
MKKSSITSTPSFDSTPRRPVARHGARGVLAVDVDEAHLAELLGQEG